MPRQQFDKKTALKNSVSIFWRQGFHGTSMQDILKATNLKAGSIYHAFNSKEGLFKECLQFYAKVGLTRTSQTLNDASSVGAGICQILKKMIKESANEDYCSCFLIKSQLEITENQTELDECITTYIERIEQHYLKYLAREYDQQTSKNYATSLMLHIFGIRVYGYQKRNPETLLASVKLGLDWLPWEEQIT